MIDELNCVYVSFFLSHLLSLPWVQITTTSREWEHQISTELRDRDEKRRDEDDEGKYCMQIM